jgi:hypothetical protein
MSITILFAPQTVVTSGGLPIRTMEERFNQINNPKSIMEQTK